MLRSSMPFARLEDRLLMTAEPSVTIDVPDTVELGNTFEATIRFDNSATNAAGNVGFGPYVDLFLPVTGTDGAGAAVDDGMDFINATYLGVPLVATEITFDASGNATHPYATDTSGNPIVVNGAPGDKLVVLQLPFGSFTPDQTPADIVVTLDMSDMADLDRALRIDVVGGFRYGSDALDNPGTDAPLRSVVRTDSVTPSLIDLEKVYIGPEDETATGPSYRRFYDLQVDIATDQTVNNVNITDFLPPELVFVGATVTQGNASFTSFTSLPTSGVPSVAPGNQVIANFASITGAAGVDAIVRIEYYVGRIDAAGGEVLGTGQGEDKTVVNTSSVTGSFVPIDSRDPIVAVRDDASVIDPTSEFHNLEASPLVIQKSAAIVVDSNIAGLSPRDVIEYTLQIQLSDYFTVGDIVVSDLLSDGQTFDTSFTPVIVANERGTATPSAAFLAANFTASPKNTDGETALSFRVSDELVSRGQDGIIAGGNVNGASYLADNAGLGATTVTIRFRAIVDDTFVTAPPGGVIDIGQGDDISNTATVAATVRDNATPTAVTETTQDDTAVTLEIVTGAITKSIYAVNGSTTFASNQIQAGDTITFRITYDLPLSKFEDFQLRDFLPLPVFDSSEVTSFSAAAPSGTPPAAGVAQLGLTDTFTALSAIRPTISENGDSNQLNFTYGDFAAATPQFTRVDILFTVTVVDADFVDGLFLTNQATGAETSTGQISTATNAIVQFVYEQPELELTKGVVSKSHGGTFTNSVGPGPSTPGGTDGVSFATPGSVGAAFSGTITSGKLDVTAIDANLNGIDAGDLVKFAVVVENVGNADEGAFNVRIRDTLPTGFAIPTTGQSLNLRVTDGAGNALSFTTIGGGLFDPTGGIELTDPTATQGALETFSGTNGRNLVVITYDLVAEQSVEPGDRLVNTATVTNFAARETGINRAEATDPRLTDTAQVTITLPAIDKVLVSTSHDGPTVAGATADDDVTIGEEIVYRITVTVPEGTLQNAVLTDLVPGTNPGTLQLISASVIAVGTGLIASSPAPTAQFFDDVGGDGRNDRVTFNFGTIVNAFDNDADRTDEQITIEVRARVVNDDPTARGDVLTNTGRLTWTQDGTQRSVSDSVTVDVVEPDITVVKDAPAGPFDGDDTVPYTITFTNTGSATAYGLAIEDLLDARLVLIAGVTVSTPGYATTTVTSGNTAGDSAVRATASELRVGDTITVSFNARVIPNIPIGQTIPNTATVDYSSLPPNHPVPSSDDFDRDYRDDGSETIPIDGPAIDKELVSTSHDDSPAVIAATNGNVATIGEIVTYRITVTIPEGITANAVLSDLALASNPGTLEILSATIERIGANLTNSAGLTIGAAATPVDGMDSDTLADSAAFSFGTITNVADNVRNAADQVAILVTARISNEPGTGAGDVLVNRGTFTYSGGSVSDDVSVSVVEPAVTIDITTPPGTYDAGDEVTYTVVIRNQPGASTAYDVSITDLLADLDLDLVPGSVAVTAAPAYGTQAVTGNATSVGATTSELRAGDSMTITFRGRILDSAAFASTVDTTSRVEYSTLPSDHPGGDAAERDYAATDSVGVPTAAPALDKSIFSTNINQTGTAEFTATLDDLAIGEEVTFQIVMTLPEGSSNINLVDQLPQLGNGKLGYVSSTVVSLGGASGSGLLPVGSSGTASDSNADGILDAVAFNFGNIVNIGDNVPGNNQIIVTVTARVLDIPINVAGDLLISPVTMTYTDGTATPQQLTDSVQVEIVEPVLAITKTANTVGANPGDLVTYTLVVSHTAASTSNAFDVVLSDLLSDANLQFVPGTVTVNGVAETPSISTLVGDGFEVRLAEITQTETVTITYQARLLGTAPRAADFDNTANLAWDSRPGDGLPTPVDDGRPGTASTSDRIFTPPILDKAVFSTNNPSTGTDQFDATLTDLTVGETVTYRLTVTLPETLNRNLVITDVAPAGLELLTARFVSSGMTITAPGITVTSGLVTFNFGDVINPFDGSTGADDVIVLEVTGRVLDVVGNIDGTVLTNTANLAVRIGAGTPGTPGAEARDFTTSDTVDVEVVEPLLTIDKSRDIPRGDAGTEVTYTLVIRHDTTAPGVSHTSAHDVVIEDLVNDPDLQLVAGSVTVDGVPTLGAELVGDGFRVNVAEIPLGDTVTITYRALILNSAVIGDTLDNTATLAWDSQPGTGGRTGTAQDSESVIVDRAPIEFTKTVVATSLDRTGSRIFDASVPDLEIGETVTYRLTATLAEGTDTITIVDRLPTGNGVLDYVSARVVSVGGNITLGGATSITNIGNVVTFNFGSLVNAFDNVVTDADRIVVEVTARVPNSPLNGNGDRLTNTATLTSIDGTISATADVELLVPQGRDRDPVRAVSGYVDDARSMPLISLNPFFSGTAEYGSFVTVTLRDSSGSIVGTQGGFADAGGNWVASFPLSTSEIENDLERDRDLYFVTSRLFSDSHGVIGQNSGSLAQAHWANREVYIGARLLDQPYTVEVHQELASYNAGLDGAFNARAYFTPVITNEVFGQERQIDVQKVFEDRAEFSLDQLYAAALAPLGLGSNRFTNEFLAIAGSAAGR
mgnify:CR=1 FL=1